MENRALKHYVYIVSCKDSTLYTGYTNHITKRLEAHNKGIAAKYTRGRSPVTLLYQESFATKSEALKREAEIKKLSRSQKLTLINANPEVYL